MEKIKLLWINKKIEIARSQLEKEDYQDILKYVTSEMTPSLK